MDGTNNQEKGCDLLRLQGYAAVEETNCFGEGQLQPYLLQCHNSAHLTKAGLTLMRLNKPERGTS